MLIGNAFRSIRFRLVPPRCESRPFAQSSSAHPDNSRFTASAVINGFATWWPLLQSFFGRSYNNLSSISECKNNGECVINKKNRTACKACRLRKCLLVGMSKSGSRYGRRSNWFKIHCLLQQQQQQQAGVGGVGGMPPTPVGLIRPQTYYPHYTGSNPAASDAKSSESDSGASSADPEDELRSASAFSCFAPTTSPSSDRSNVSSLKISPSYKGDHK